MISHARDRRRIEQVDIVIPDQHQPVVDLSDQHGQVELGDALLQPDRFDHQALQVHRHSIEPQRKSRQRTRAGVRRLLHRHHDLDQRRAARSRSGWSRSIRRANG